MDLLIILLISFVAIEFVALLSESVGIVKWHYLIVCKQVAHDPTSTTAIAG